jgi:hypothetical protein
VGFHESVGGATGLGSLDEVAAASARFREEVLPQHMRLSVKDAQLEGGTLPHHMRLSVKDGESEGGSLSVGTN